MDRMQLIGCFRICTAASVGCIADFPRLVRGQAAVRDDVFRGWNSLGKRVPFGLGRKAVMLMAGLDLMISRGRFNQGFCGSYL